MSKANKMEWPDTPVFGSQTPCTKENVEYLLGKYGIVCRYNLIKKKEELVFPAAAKSWDNSDNSALANVQSLANRHGLATSQLMQMIAVIADENPYNPAQEWIVSVPWDREDRLTAFAETLHTVEDFDRGLLQILVLKWLLSAVAAACLEQGFRSRGVLTLQGPQGIGKTSWARNLITDEALRDQVLKLDHHLDVGNKDSVIGAMCHWIVELGELESSFRRDVARLKGVLTNDRDKIRRPYARVEAEYGRRTAFMATVNQSDFLVDATGNSRWWTIPLVSVNFDHGIDMQQVFAQLYVEFKAGAQWWLTAEEERQLEAWNKRHRAYSPVYDHLSEIVDWDADPGSADRFTATELLSLAGLERPSNPQAKECASILREHFGEPKRINGKMKWRVPLVQTTVDHRSVANGPVKPGGKSDTDRDKFD